MRTEGKSWWPQEHLSTGDVEKAISGGHADVMISHDAPDTAHIPGLLSDRFPGQFPADQLALSQWHRCLIGNVAAAVTPRLLMHGHYHVRYTDTIGKSTQVIGLADDSAPLNQNLLVLDLDR